MVPGVGFSELLLIGIVALIVVGPRDLPKLARMAAGYIRQARGLARDFQKSFDEMGRSLEIDDLRKEVEALKRGDPLKDVTSEIRALERDIKTMEQRAVSPAMRRTSVTPLASPAAPRATTPPTLVSPAASPKPPAELPAPQSQPGSSSETPTETPAGDGPPREDRKLSGA